MGGTGPIADKDRAGLQRHFSMRIGGWFCLRCFSQLPKAAAGAGIEAAQPGGLKFPGKPAPGYFGAGDDRGLSKAFGPDRPQLSKTEPIQMDKLGLQVGGHVDLHLA